MQSSMNAVTSVPSVSTGTRDLGNERVLLEKLETTYSRDLAHGANPSQLESLARSISEAAMAAHQTDHLPTASEVAASGALNMVV